MKNNLLRSIFLFKKQLIIINKKAYYDIILKNKLFKTTYLYKIVY